MPNTIESPGTKLFLIVINVRSNSVCYQNEIADNMDIEVGAACRRLEIAATRNDVMDISDAMTEGTPYRVGSGAWLFQIRRS